MSGRRSLRSYGGAFAAFAAFAVSFIGTTYLVGKRQPSVFHDGSICRAAISTLFGRPADIISVASSAGNEILTTYVRPNDGTVWRNRCRVGSGTVIWATETGRWRTDPLDEKLTFRFNGRVLEMKMVYTDGSATTQQFALEELQPETTSTVASGKPSG